MSRLISTPLTPVHAPLSPVIADCGSSVSPDWDQAAGRLLTRASTEVREDFTITEKAPTRAFSWLKAPGWDIDAKIIRDRWLGYHSVL